MLHYAMKRKIRGDKKEIEEKESVAIKLMEKGILDLTPSTMNELVRYDRTFGNEKMTQLIYNISRGNKDLAKQLIEAQGIDLNKKDEEGITAYGYAVHKQYKDLTDIMESKVRNIDKKEKVEKDFLGITDTKTAMIVAAGGLMAGVGILAKTTKTGGMVFDLLENVVIDKGKEFLNEDTKGIIEGIQENKKAVQNTANKMLESVGINLKPKSSPNKNMKVSAVEGDEQEENDGIHNFEVTFRAEKPKLNSRPTIGIASLDRERQIDERDVFSEVGRQVEEKGWIPEGRILGPGRIYTCTMYVHGQEIKIEESDKLIKVGNEFYVCEDTLPKISSNNFVNVNGMKMLTQKGTYTDIENELSFEEDQKVNGKGVDFKIKIQEQSNSGHITQSTYYHLESIVELGMREHFYTNRLQKEMYVVKNAATREGGYGLVVYEDGYIKNVKMEKLYIVKKDSTVEKITPFTEMKKGLVGLYDKIIPDGWADIENLNKADEALGDVILVSASTAAGLGETGFALTPQGGVVIVSSLGVAAGAGLGQACIRVAKKDFYGALLSLCGATYFTTVAAKIGMDREVVENKGGGKAGAITEAEIIKNEIAVGELKKEIKLEDVENELKKLGWEMKEDGLFIEEKGGGKNLTNTRQVFFEDPDKKAKEVWESLSSRKIPEPMPNDGKGMRITLDDGAIITYRTREEKKSDSAAIEISTRTITEVTKSKLAPQKIHFVEIWRRQD